MSYTPDPWEITDTGSRGTAHGKITLTSEGWSGQVVKNDGVNNDFTFDVTGSGTYSNQSYTIEASGGYAFGGGGQIIGISLEHMGKVTEESSSRKTVQFLGMANNASHSLDFVAAWGALESDTALTVLHTAIMVERLTINESTRQNLAISNITLPYVYAGIRTLCDGNWYAVDAEITIETDLPIFETDEDLLEYCNSGGTITNKILNYEEVTPEEEYVKARNYRYAWNIFGHNTENATAYTGYRNYRFYGGDGKICFYRVTPSAGSPFTVRLYHYQSYTIKAAGAHDTDTEDFETITNPQLYFLHKSIQFANDDYYTKFKFSTDLLIFGSEALAEEYVQDIIDARAAENFNEVSRAYNQLIDPGYGNPDEGNDNGYNGQSYVHGARLWVMTSSQLNHFFDDIFDPVHISDILDGTKLLGDGISAIQGITYFPIDIDDVATVYGNAQSIKIGSYTCPTAEGRYVMNNNKMIDCGSVFIAPVYNDYRDYKIKLYISLPYCGFHCLDPISKYMGHNLQVKYAVDITTGGCTAYIYADGIYYGDSFDGFMASQRPLTALDQTAYLNAVMGCVSSMVSRETGMLNTAVEGMAGAANGKISGGGDIAGINTSAGALGDLYGLSQAVKDTPMQTRGGFAGCLGFFGNQKIHIVTAQSKTVKPTLEQSLIGYPSHVSQTVGSFSGYLKCSYFKMAAGFTGTLEELKEIIEMMQGGVYI